MSWGITAAGVLLGGMACGLTYFAIRLRHTEQQAPNQPAPRQIERRQELASEAAGIGTWAWDLERDEIWASAQARLLYGFAPDEPINLNRYLLALHDDDRAAVLAAVTQSLKAGGSFQREYRVVLPDGRINWIATRGRVEAGLNGKASIVRGISLDISERKQREEELRQERAFLRLVIDTNPNLIFAKDRQGRFTLVNQAVADLYGKTVEQLIGKTDADFNPNADEVLWFQQVDREVIDHQQQRHVREEHVTDAKGKVHWLETVKLPLFDTEGRVNQLVGTAIDVTQRKQAELELAQQRNELAHLSRVMMLSELSGSLAHELNQPLTAVLSNAQAALRFLAQDEPDLDEIRDILNDIVNDDKRAGEVIQRLRQMLKKGEMQSEALDCNELVQNVLTLLRSDLLNNGVSATIQLAESLPMIRGDRVQLQQVLINLVMNSCDAMADIARSDRHLQIATQRETDHLVRICVSDRGHGIAPERLERVFESFFTTKQHGLGLGLTVCRRIIGAHGGHLWAERGDGTGARFCFTVPTYTGDAK